MMMARAKRIYILIVKVNKLFSLFSLQCFLKEIENMFFVFLSSYRNTRESLGELEKEGRTGGVSGTIYGRKNNESRILKFHFPESRK